MKIRFLCGAALAAALVMAGCASAAPAKSAEVVEAPPAFVPATDITCDITDGGALARFTPVPATATVNKVQVEVVDDGGVVYITYDAGATGYFIGFFKGGVATVRATVAGGGVDGADVVKDFSITVPEIAFANATWSNEDETFSLTINADGTWSSTRYYTEETPWAKGTWSFGGKRQDSQEQVTLVVTHLYGSYLGSLWYAAPVPADPGEDHWYTKDELAPGGEPQEWLFDTQWWDRSDFNVEFASARIGYGINSDNTLRLTYWNGAPIPTPTLFTRYTPAK